VLDGACQPAPRVVTREGVEQQVAALLRRGVTSPSGGGVLLWPYLRALQVYERLETLGPSHEAGYPPARLGLGLLFETLYGYPDGIRAIDPVSRADFGLLAGLPWLPAATTQYRYLQAIPVLDALGVQVAFAQHLAATDRVTPGGPINLDAHNVRTYSRKEMKRSYLPEEKGYGKAFRFFYTQDQTSRLPLIALATYSGTTVSQATPPVIAHTQQALGASGLLVADKEWYCGALLQELRQRGVPALVPAKLTARRQAAYDRIPLDAYLPTLDGPIARITTTLKNFDGPLVALIRPLHDGTYWALLCTEPTVPTDTALPAYTGRWHIEDFFLHNNDLAIDRLPSLNLQAVQAMLTIRLLAFHVLEAFRRDLGEPYARQTPGVLRRQFLLPVQMKLQARDRQTVTVTVYGCAQQAVLHARYQQLSQQLRAQDIDPRLPWLGNRELIVRFA